MAAPHDVALHAYLTQVYARPFSGWDFSAFHEGRVSIRPQDSWDYTEAVQPALRSAQSVLDMDTGGGEYLARLAPLPSLVCATEGYAPNVPLAATRLRPLGVHVVAARVAATLPFADQTFDLILNRHGALNAAELRRVLAPGGTFITQQVGSETNRRFHELLGDNPQKAAWNLALCLHSLEAAGFIIETAREETAITRYFDIGTIVSYFKAVPWEVPDFSVERYFDRLIVMRDLIQANGSLDVPFHTFFIVARKPC